jgi:hypothetical protein
MGDQESGVDSLDRGLSGDAGVVYFVARTLGEPIGDLRLMISDCISRMSRFQISNLKSEIYNFATKGFRDNVE